MHRRLMAILFLVGLLMLLAPKPVAACGGTWHTVWHGETLFSIGRRYGVNPWSIASANKLANPNCIYAGQRLYIPGGGCCSGPCYSGCGSYYVVRCGDTLTSIAYRYGVSTWSIARVNGICNMNHIRAGQSLYIPCP
jgi:LysM repeat protein